MAWLFTGAALSLSSALATRRQRQCFSGFQFSMNKQLLPCIAELYELLRSDGGYLFGGFASQDDEDAAHDLFEHETLITPAACKMLNGFETLHPLDKAALQEPILFGTRLMKMQGGTKERMTPWKIGHLEHLLRYARNLEELRQVCLRCMTDP